MIRSSRFSLNKFRVRSGKRFSKHIFFSMVLMLNLPYVVRVINGSWRRCPNPVFVETLPIPLPALTLKSRRSIDGLYNRNPYTQPSRCDSKEITPSLETTRYSLQ